jgi:L-aminopeptidase/D-esterase-like protein
LVTLLGQDVCMSGTIADVEGVRVGQAEDAEARTGCSVVLVPPGTMGGIAAIGWAPAARELDLLRVDGVTREVHAVLLTGGSAFGLDAAGGVLSYLEEQGIGFDAGVARVPLVPTLSLFDLAAGRADVRPDAEMARRACEAAGKDVAEGAVGAGAGATVGKLLGPAYCSPSGIGTASAKAAGVTVGVLAVANAFGDLVDSSGRIVAGARDPKDNRRFVDTASRLAEHGMPKADAFDNCTFAVVAVDARLDRRTANVLASMAMTGISRAVRPAHTLFDFDAVIALGCGSRKPDIHALGTVAADLVAEALVRGAKAAAIT